MDQNRDAQFGTFLPDGRQSFIIYRNPLTSRIKVPQSQAFINFQAFGSVLYISFQLFYCCLRPSGIANPVKIYIGKNHKPVGVVFIYVRHSLLDPVAGAAAQIHHNGHVHPVHIRN